MGGAGSQEYIVQELQKLSRQMERLHMTTHSQFSFLPSSTHDEQFIQNVVTFYGNKRCCCLTGALDPGHGGGLPEYDRVHASHIIRTSDPGLLLAMNQAYRDREFLTSESPRNAILLQKRWEVLFDLHCWCLLPESPLSTTPNFKVHVFASTDGPEQMTFLQASVKKPYPLHDWISCLQSYHGKSITFAQDHAPSFRALSAHALQTVQFANAMRWNVDDAADVFRPFADLSGLHSPPAGDTAEETHSPS
jgi:hypothetical protein